MVAVKLTKKRRVFSRHSSSVTFWPLESAFRKSDLYGAAYSAALRRARKKVAGLVGTQATLPGTMGLVGGEGGDAREVCAGQGSALFMALEGKGEGKGRCVFPSTPARDSRKDASFGDRQTWVPIPACGAN